MRLLSRGGGKRNLGVWEPHSVSSVKRKKKRRDRGGTQLEVGKEKIVNGEDR